MKKSLDEQNQLQDAHVEIQPVFDILNVGTRHLFWANGKLVHNSELNIQNLPSGRVAGQSNAMRMAIEAPEGQVVVAADSSQIEARVLAYCANQQDLLYNFAHGVDPYCAMASRIYGIPADEIKAGHKAGDAQYTKMRQIAKATILGAGYGLGGTGFSALAKASYGLDLDDEQAKNLIAIYRQANPNIVDFWATCNQVLYELVQGKSGTFGGPHGTLFKYGFRQLFNDIVAGIELPDGMWLYYRNLRIEQVEQYGRLVDSFVYDRVVQRQSKTIKIYGGALTENVVQALAFAIMKRQAIKIAQRYPIAFNVHDEFVCVAPEDQAEQAKSYLEACMNFVPSWVAGCPITCEASYAKQYGAC